mgnify:CR=1 FL=1
MRDFGAARGAPRAPQVDHDRLAREGAMRCRQDVRAGLLSALAFGPSRVATGLIP